MFTKTEFLHKTIQIIKASKKHLGHDKTEEFLNDLKNDKTEKYYVDDPYVNAWLFDDKIICEKYKFSLRTVTYPNIGVYFQLTIKTLSDSHILNQGPTNWYIESDPYGSIISIDCSTTDTHDKTIIFEKLYQRKVA